jgi:hypothetical protein
LFFFAHFHYELERQVPAKIQQKWHFRPHSTGVAGSFFRIFLPIGAPGDFKSQEREKPAPELIKRG